MRATRRTLLLIAGAAIVLPALSGLIFTGSARREWSKLDATIDRLESAHGPRERSPLTGAAEPGEAFAHYIEAHWPALRAHLHCGKIPRYAYAELDQTSASAPEQAHFLARAEPVLATLHAGARRRQAHLDLDWDSSEREWPWAVTPIRFELNERCTTSLSSRDLHNIAFGAFLLRLSEGEAEAGLVHVLDALQFARDLAHTPLLFDGTSGIGCLVTGDHLRFAAEGGFGALSAAQTARWLDALALIDAELPTMDSAAQVRFALEARTLQAFLLTSPTWYEGAFKFVLAPLTARASRWARTTYAYLLEFAEEHERAWQANPTQAASLYAAYLAELEAHALNGTAGDLQTDVASALIEDVRYYSSRRMRALAELRLFRFALSAWAGRGDVPAHDRLGTPITLTDVDGMRRYAYATDRYKRCIVELPLDSFDENSESAK